MQNLVYFRLIFPDIDPNFLINPEAEIHARHQDTYQCLTPRFTEAELDGYIDDLIKELNYIRQEAKRKFSLSKT